MSRRPRKAAFFHLDLGVGGAEQLVLQTALQTYNIMRDSQYIDPQVDLFTSYMDDKRCMEAAKDSRLNVIVLGSFLPHCIMGYFRVACSVVRMLYLVLAAMITGHVGYDVVFNDQVSVVNPLLRLIGRKVIFYGHFPDQLLVQKQPSLLRSVYRYPFNKLEAFTTAMCDMLMVNSHFTAETFCRVFPSLRKVKLHVLYPPVSTEVEDFRLRNHLCHSERLFGELHGFDFSLPFAVSVNRFEPKKNIELAIRAVARLPENLPCNLILAGGFDPRLSECRECFTRLQHLARELNFLIVGCNEAEKPKDDATVRQAAYMGRRRVLFLKNISGPLKLFLLKKSVCLLYTPIEEHFGIVPCEAMYVGCLPVACDTGGPRETIVNEETGFLCTPSVETFSACLQRILTLSLVRSAELDVMRSKAAVHAEKCFSPDVFRRSLQTFLEEVVSIWAERQPGDVKARLKA